VTKKTGERKMARRRAGTRNRAWIGWIVVVAVLITGTTSALQVSRMHDTTPREVTYIVVPHPDDEFQAWSLIEDTPDQYKVFLVLTNGEQTQYCEPGGYAASYQPGLEAAADPIPDGRNGEKCGEARAHSLIDYISGMAKTDPTIPGDFAAPAVAGPFPAEAGTVCRRDGPDCTVEDHDAQVWVDRQGRGAVVMLDLGDGDLTADEVRWGVSTVVANRESLGLEHTLPNGGIFGSFANSRYDCFSYPHPDHVAVHDALWSTNFNAGPQLAATCADDPAGVIHRKVSDDVVEAAFAVDANGVRQGAHTYNYGWLDAAYYPVDRRGQTELFTQNQYFWTRFAP